LNPGDREYKVGLNQEHDVLVDLGQPTRYVVLSPERALDLAAWLVKHAKKSPKCPPSS
jgi:hypothetical protein